MVLSLMRVNAMELALRRARSVAVLGIKPESRGSLDAHQIPLYLHKVGYEIIPVPVRYPDVDRVLGREVYRRVSYVSARFDILNVFCKPRDLAAHASAILAVRPPIVWFQSGLLDLEWAMEFQCVGIQIAEDCIGCRRAAISPSVAPLEGQATE